MKTKTSQQKWREKNPEVNRLNSYRSTARTFVRYYATDEDIKNLLEIYKNENPNAKKEG